jgi:hypothetical protein
MLHHNIRTLVLLMGLAFVGVAALVAAVRVT